MSSAARPWSTARPRLRGGGLRRLRRGAVVYLPQVPAHVEPGVGSAHSFSRCARLTRRSTGATAPTPRVRHTPSARATTMRRRPRSSWPLPAPALRRPRAAVACAHIRLPAAGDGPRRAHHGPRRRHQARVLQPVREFCRPASPRFYVSHDLAVVAGLADQIAVMFRASSWNEKAGPHLLRGSSIRTRGGSASVARTSRTRGRLGIRGRAPLPEATSGGCTSPRAAGSPSRAARRICRPSRSYRRRRAPRLLLRADDAPVGDRGRRVARADRPAGDVLSRSEHVDASYSSHQILHDVDFEVRRPCVALVGESGSGKTTTARCITGLHHQYTGEMQLDSLKPAGRARAGPRKPASGSS